MNHPSHPTHSDHKGSPHKGHGNLDFGKFTIRKLGEAHYAMLSPSSVMRMPMNSFFYLTQGEVFLQIDNDSILLRAGEMVLIPASVAVTISYYDKIVGYMGGFSSDFITDVSQNIIERFDFLRYFNASRFTFEGELLDRINLLFATLDSLWNGGGEREDLVKAYLLTLLHELDELRGEKLSTTPYNRLAYSFLELMFGEAQIVKKPSDYASQLCVSVNHLNKVVRQTTNKSLSEWIEERLILNAKVLLRNSSLSIAEIANQLGVADPSYFTRRFRQYEGISPKEYRERSGK